MEVTFKIKNGQIVTEATQETDALGLKEGARLVVVKTSAGLALVREDLADDMQVVSRVIEEEHDVLEKLAASERMDKAKAIMEQYSGALAELAK